MNKDIYYIAAKNLLKWAPEYRRDIMDKLISPYDASVFGRPLRK